MTSDGAGDTDFGDVLAANARYASAFTLGALRAPARRGLAIVTCMDSRIEPLAAFGLQPGDAKILRNAGARVHEGVLRDLVLAQHLLDVTRVLVMAHTNCAMSSATPAQVADAFAADGIDPVGLDLGLIDDQLTTLTSDVDLIRGCPYFSSGLVAGGFLYDVQTGSVRRIT